MRNSGDVYIDIHQWTLKKLKLHKLPPILWSIYIFYILFGIIIYSLSMGLGWLCGFWICNLCKNIYWCNEQKNKFLIKPRQRYHDDEFGDCCDACLVMKKLTESTQ